MPIDDFSDDNSIKKPQSSKIDLPPIKAHQQRRKERTSFQDFESLKERFTKQTISKENQLPKIDDEMNDKSKSYRDKIRYYRRSIHDENEIKSRKEETSPVSSLNTSSESSISSEDSSDRFLPDIKKYKI